MTAMWMTLLSVLAIDQMTKLMLRRLSRDRTLVLGTGNDHRMVTTSILLTRLDNRCKGWIMWCVWTAAAVTLLFASTLASFNPIPVGLLLGASLSQALEISVRGRITDYVCVQGWPAFNFADLALASGAIGVIVELFIITRQIASG